MKIIKNSEYRFVCPHCGCVFLAEEDECLEEVIQPLCDYNPIGRSSEEYGRRLMCGCPICEKAVRIWR